MSGCAACRHPATPAGSGSGRPDGQNGRYREAERQSNSPWASAGCAAAAGSRRAMLLAAVLPAATHVTPAGVAGRELEGCIFSGCAACRHPVTPAGAGRPDGQNGRRTGAGRQKNSPWASAGCTAAAGSRRAVFVAVLLLPPGNTCRRCRQGGSV